MVEYVREGGKARRTRDEETAVNELFPCFVISRAGRWLRLTFVPSTAVAEGARRGKGDGTGEVMCRAIAVSVNCLCACGCVRVRGREIDRFALCAMSHSLLREGACGEAVHVIFTNYCTVNARTWLRNVDRRCEYWPRQGRQPLADRELQCFMSPAANPT